MTKLNKIIKEDINRLPVTLSYDYATKTYKVVDEKDKELYSGDKWKMNTWLIENDARMFAPRFTANYPLSVVNKNAGDITHFSTESLLELLRIRNGAEELKITICPRAVVKGADKLLNIEPELLGESLVKSLKDSSLLGFAEEADQNEIKKLIIRKSDDTEEPQVALILGMNKYYPVNPEEANTPGFEESLCQIMKQQGCEVDKAKVAEALKTVGLHIFEEEVAPREKVNNIIKEQEVVFESKNINQLSNTFVRLSANAETEGWKVSPIKESGKYFSFEVTGKESNKNLADDNYMLGFLTGGVRFNRNSALLESTEINKALFALNNGLALNEAVDALLGNGSFEKKTALSESTEDNAEEAPEPYKPLFSIKQIVADKIYKISEWRAVDAKTAKEEFIAENPDYVNKKLEVELIEDCPPAGTTSTAITGAIGQMQLAPMKKKDDEDVKSVLDSMIESYGYDGDGTVFDTEPQSTIDEDTEAQKWFSAEVGDKVYDEKTGLYGTIVKKTSVGNYGYVHIDFAGKIKKLNVMDYLQTQEPRYKIVDESIADPQPDGADAAIAEEEFGSTYEDGFEAGQKAFEDGKKSDNLTSAPYDFIKGYNAGYDYASSKSFDNNDNENELDLLIKTEETDPDVVKKVQSICYDLWSHKIDKEEARKLIKAADENIMDSTVDLMVDAPSMFVPVEESSEKEEKPLEYYNKKYGTIFGARTKELVSKGMKELDAAKKAVAEYSGLENKELDEGLMGLVGGALMGAATVGGFQGAIGTALMASRLEDQRKEAERLKQEEENRRRDAEWARIHGFKDQKLEEDDGDTNNPEAAPADNSTAEGDDIIANDPATNDKPQDTEIDIDLNNNNGSINDLLGSEPINDVNPPVDDQYSANAGMDTGLVQNKAGEVIGIDNGNLIVQWEDGTTTTEKPSKVKLA